MSVFSTLWQRIRRFGLELYCFFTAPFVVRNCLSMLAMAGMLLLLSLWWLKCYTDHGKSVQVPAFEGLSFREAARKARVGDFNLVVNDSVYLPGKAPGEVLRQNPKANSRVKQGRTIYCTVAKNNPDIVRLPDLSGGDDYDLYSRKCLRLGLKPRISARVPDPKIEPNTVIGVLYRGDTITRKLREGYNVEMGAALDLIVTEAANEMVNVPNCLCKTFGEAQFLLTTSQLSLGSVIADGTVTNRESAFVYRQTPKFGPEEQKKIGEQVDLYLTQERPSACQ